MKTQQSCRRYTPHSAWHSDAKRRSIACENKDYTIWCSHQRYTIDAPRLCSKPCYYFLASPFPTKGRTSPSGESGEEVQDLISVARSKEVTKIQKSDGVLLCPVFIRSIYGRGTKNIYPNSVKKAKII